MQSVSMKVSHLSYEHGTLRFTKVPRTFSVYVCIQQGACANQEDIGKRAPDSDVILHLESLDSISKKRSLKMKVNVLKLDLWNLRTTVRPGDHTIMIHSEYYVGDTNETESSWTFLPITLDSTEVLSFNLRIRSLIAMRGIDPSKRKRLKSSPRNVIPLEAQTSSQTTSTLKPATADETGQTVVKA